MRTRKLYTAIAHTLQAIENCKKSPNRENAEYWIIVHSESLNHLVNNYMPSGSGIDSGTNLDDSSSPTKLVFTFSYHHMSENGYYTHWSDHKCIVTGSLISGIDIRITNVRKSDYDLSDYLWQTFESALNQNVEG